MAQPAVNAVKQHAFKLSAQQVVDHLPKRASWVLIGEASHGTKDFYEHRIEITKRLIELRGFHAVAVEADFPDAFRANLWVRGLSEDKSAEEALSDFQRFPQWMWRNTTVVEFLTWLYNHNTCLDPEQRYLQSVGFYGLDVYSLNTSTAIVVEYLKHIDPKAAEDIEKRYACFDSFGSEGSMYGLALGLGFRPCEEDALQALLQVRRKAEEHRQALRSKLTLNRMAAEEWDFAAIENARVVKDAEAYYRHMYFSEEATWNIRGRHMVDSAESLAAHLRQRGIAQPKIVIWAHNSHLGDARATDMGRRRNEVNVGQLMRERQGSKDSNAVVNIGFTTHVGRVAAADNWDEPVKFKAVNPSLPESWERLLHDVGKPSFGLDFRRNLELARALEAPRLERAIGVIYAPKTERWSHYFSAWLPQQFDIVLHVDETDAVQPLDPGEAWDDSSKKDLEPPETFPFAV